jgi:hypothetical protein
MQTLDDLIEKLNNIIIHQQKLFKTSTPDFFQGRRLGLEEAVQSAKELKSKILETVMFGSVLMDSRLHAEAMGFAMIVQDKRIFMKTIDDLIKYLENEVVATDDQPSWVAAHNHILKKVKKLKANMDEDDGSAR